MSKKNQQQGVTFRLIAIDLAAGAAAGTVSLHWLDTIKTRLQLQATSQIKQYHGPLDALLKITKNEGFIGLYKGITPVAASVIPKTTVRFASFAQFSRLLSSWSESTGGYNPVWHTFVAGALTGATEAILVVSVTELVKIRLQEQQGGPKQGMLQTIKTLQKTEGIRGLYKGLHMTVIRQIGNQSIKFPIYTQSKRLFQNNDPNQKLTMVQTMVCGGVANFFSATINSPLDTIKTNIQKSSTGQYKPSVVSTVKYLYSQGGVKTFFQGLSPRILRLVPGGAIQFSIYEYMYFQLASKW